MGRQPFQEFLRTLLYNSSFCLHTTGESKEQLLNFFLLRVSNKNSWFALKPLKWTPKHCQWIPDKPALCLLESQQQLQALQGFPSLCGHPIHYSWKRQWKTQISADPLIFTLLCLFVCFATTQAVAQAVSEEPTALKTKFSRKSIQLLGCHEPCFWISSAKTFIPSTTPSFLAWNLAETE